MKSLYSLILSLALTASLVFSGSAMALENSLAVKKKQSCQLISNSEAIQQAKSRTGGKVLSVKLKRNGNRSVYRVRVLVGEKRVKNVSIKACR